MLKITQNTVTLSSGVTATLIHHEDVEGCFCREEDLTIPRWEYFEWWDEETVVRFKYPEQMQKFEEYECPVDGWRRINHHMGLTAAKNYPTTPTRTVLIRKDEEAQWIELDQNNLPKPNLIMEFKHPEYGIVRGNIVYYGPDKSTGYKQSVWVFPDDEGRSADIWIGEFTHYRKIRKAVESNPEPEPVKTLKQCKDLIAAKKYAPVWSKWDNLPAEAMLNSWDEVAELYASQFRKP